MKQDQLQSNMNPFPVVEDKEYNIHAKEIIGILLIIIGTSIALWIFKSVIDLFNNPANFERFQDLINTDFTFQSATENRETVIFLPAVLLSYLFPILLLSIAASIAKMFVRYGVELIYGAYQKYKKKLSSVEYKLGRKIEDLKYTLDKSLK